MVPNAFLFPCICVPFMYLSLPFMFICLWSLCPVILGKKTNFHACSFHFFVHDLPCLLMFLFSFLLLPTFFYFFSRYFILMHFISFHFPFMCVIFHVLPLSVHILSLSLHVMSKSSQKKFGMHDLGHHGGHNLCVWILRKNIHTYRNISFRVRAISLSFLFTFLWSVFIFIPVLVKWGVGSGECWVWSE